MEHIKQATELIFDELDELLKPISNTIGLFELVNESLNQTRESLVSDSSNGLWKLLPLMVCESLCGHFKHVIPVAVALLLLKEAAEILDDIEDDDSLSSVCALHGPAKATNIATALIILAEKSISRLSNRGVADALIVKVSHTVNSFYLNCCLGQQLDLSNNSEKDITEQDYIKIAGLKSASPVECACVIGALLANANQKQIEIFAEFGRNVGIASQIANDINGVVSKHDIINRKITLPIIYALSQADGSDKNHLSLIASRESEYVPESAIIKRILYQTGAIYYSIIKMESYKQRAMNSLLKAEQSGAHIENLKVFISRAKSSYYEIQ